MLRPGRTTMWDKAENTMVDTKSLSILSEMRLTIYGLTLHLIVDTKLMNLLLFCGKLYTSNV